MDRNDYLTDADQTEIASNMLMPEQQARLSATEHNDDAMNAELLNSSNRAVRKLVIVSCLCGVFMGTEILGGYLSGSLALMTDASHMATDLAGLLVSIFAIFLSRRKPTDRFPFGLHRAETLGALFSVLLIWIVTGVLCYVAVQRIIVHDFQVEGTEMLIVAGLGVAFNVLMGIVLHTDRCGCGHLASAAFHGHSHASGSHSYGTNHEHLPSHGCHHSHSTSHTELDNFVKQDSLDEMSTLHASHSHNALDQQNINVRAAMIHVISDLLQSIGVLIAAIVVKVKPDYKLADPICTLLFALLVLFSTSKIIKDITLILLESTPQAPSMDYLKSTVLSVGGVRSAHQVKVWALTSNKWALSCHVVADAAPAAHNQLLADIRTRLRHADPRFIDVTIQIERPDPAVVDTQHCCV